MGVPITQMARVASHVAWNRLRGRTHYPLVLMLEPLFRCNLACVGCGKIQYPSSILKQHMSPQRCFDAARECGAPMVSIAGGEPLLHPQIDDIVAGLIRQHRYVYLCTNGLLLEKNLDRFRPSRFLSLSIHLDGPRNEHDRSVSRVGAFDTAIQAVQTAVARGFRVTANCTLFADADPKVYAAFFDSLMELGVEGITIAPGYAYETASDQSRFLHRQRTVNLFQRLLGDRPATWRLNQSPLYLEFLQGRWTLECTPWGNPTYNIFGWQRPCYLLKEGYAATFDELIRDTSWSDYGRASGNPKCAECMMHCGYEPTAVAQTFQSVGMLFKVARLMRKHARSNATERDELPHRHVA